jgi:hypothetical protein
MPVLGNAESFLEDMSVPGMVNFNPMMLLHGEQTIEVFKTLKHNEEYKFD